MSKIFDGAAQRGYDIASSHVYLHVKVGAVNVNLFVIRRRNTFTAEVKPRVLRLTVKASRDSVAPRVEQFQTTLPRLYEWVPDIVLCDLFLFFLFYFFIQVYN